MRARAASLVSRAPDLAPLALPAAAVAFLALTLASELLPVPTINDGNNHFLFVRRAAEAILHGEHPLDHWVPQMELGFPEFLYYQHLPHLAVSLLGLLTFGAVDLFTLFNLVRFALLVTLPLTVFWSLRVLGLSRLGAATGGAAAPLLSAGFNFGLEYDSYLWRGWGMYTQLWASHLTFVTVALVQRAATSRRGHAAAIAAFAALALTHLAYAYMAALSAVVLALLARRRAELPARVASVALVGAATAVITSYMSLPFVLEREYLGISPNLPRTRWDSFGAEQVLAWLLGGSLFDAGRLPVLTLLVAAGAAAALLRRTRAGIAALALFGVWLVLYFGRPTLGPLADLLPLREGVPMHRFIGMVHLAGIVLAGYAAGSLGTLLARRSSRLGPLAATALAAAVLVPAFAERAAFFAGNAELMTRTRAALSRDAAAPAVLDALGAGPAGRVYAGLRTNWGERMLDLGLPFRGLRFYDLLTFEGLEPVAPPYYSWSLNADLLFHFDERDPAHHEVFAVRHAVAPQGVALPAPLRPVRAYGPYVLWEQPGASYARFVAISRREGVPTQAALLDRNIAWLAGDGPRTGRYVRYDFPAPASSVAVEAGGCPGGRIAQREVAPSRFVLATECAAPAIVVLKTTFHPGWRVTAGGRPLATFMLSPSYLGFEVPAGAHEVVAEYAAHPLKTPLALLGLAALVLVLRFRRRLDALVLRLGEPAPERDEEQQAREHEHQRLREDRSHRGRR